MQYEHTQWGRLTIAILTIVMIPVVALLMLEGGDAVIPIIVTAAIVLLVAGSFVTLTVGIDDTHLSLKFGWGLFRKKFELSELASVTRERHKWYHGWGIRYWFPQNMWIYNVSGFDVIEVTKQNGKKFRVGTDDVEALEEALKQAIR